MNTNENTTTENGRGAATLLERWLKAEISIGKLIEECGLSECSQQSRDLIGMMANTYGEMMRHTMRRLEQERESAEDCYKSCLAQNDFVNAAAEAARMRAMSDAMAYMRFICSRANNPL